MDTYKEMLKNMLSTRQVTRRLLDLCDRLDSESRKNAETSQSARCEGNALFFRSDHGNNDQVHKKILELYNKSVMYAPVESDKLTLAYAHRSALLLHVRRYEDCVLDVDRALRGLIGNPNDAMKVKLLCRKAKCLSAMGSRACSRETFQEAEQVLTDLQNDSGNIDEVLSKLLSSTKITLDKDEEDNAQPSATRTVRPEHEVTSLGSLLIEHTPEYGRHLVAQRPFEPGEVLLVERLYAANVEPRCAWTRCAHCLAIGWSAVSCPNCAWALFCSEACRDEARRLYHELECSVLPRLSCFDDELVKSFDASIRLLCRGFKELGSVQRIKSELRDVEECEDVRLNGFIRNGKFESDTFRSILSLRDDVCDDEEYTSERFIKFVALIVICLAKYTELLGEHYKWNKITDLVNNEDAIFLGALIIKLYKINKINHQVILNPSRHCQTLNDSQNYLKRDCNVIALAMSPLGSLINHSCIPNAAQCYTKGRKLIIYALKPIEKNTQIFISYTNDYWTTPLLVRKRCLRFHNFTCTCRACEEQWPCDDDENGQFKEFELSPTKLSENPKLCRKVAALKADILDFNVHDQELLSKITSTIDESRALMKEPNFVVGSLNAGYQVVFQHLNGIDQADFYVCDNTEASWK